jgi:DNA-binding response OmpR family regulator
MFSKSRWWYIPWKLGGGFMPQGARTKVLRFGAFEVDLRAGVLREGGLKIKLQGQPFQILEMLLEQPGEVVTREELRNFGLPIPSWTSTTA